MSDVIYGSSEAEQRAMAWKNQKSTDHCGVEYPSATNNRGFAGRERHAGGDSVGDGGCHGGLEDGNMNLPKHRKTFAEGDEVREVHGWGDVIGKGLRSAGNAAAGYAKKAAPGMINQAGNYAQGMANRAGVGNIVNPHIQNAQNMAQQRVPGMIDQGQGVYNNAVQAQGYARGESVEREHHAGGLPTGKQIARGARSMSKSVARSARDTGKSANKAFQGAGKAISGAASSAAKGAGQIASGVGKEVVKQAPGLIAKAGLSAMKHGGRARSGGRYHDDD